MKSLGQRLLPHNILKALAEMKISIHTPIPERIHHHRGKTDCEAQSGIYYGNTDVYKSIVHFWLAFKTWFDMNEQEYDDISWYLDAPDQIIEICPQVVIGPKIQDGLFDKFNLKHPAPDATFIEGIRIQNWWNDDIVLYDYGNEFLIYNWSTTA